MGGRGGHWLRCKEQRLSQEEFQLLGFPALSENAGKTPGPLPDMTHVQLHVHVQSRLHPGQGPALSSKCLGSDSPSALFSSRDPDSCQLCQACRWPPSSRLPRLSAQPVPGHRPRPRGAPPTWCRSTCCCSCCKAASQRAVRGQRVRAGDLAPRASRPRPPLGGPSTLVEDSMSLSSSFREVMMGMLHTGW